MTSVNPLAEIVDIVIGVDTHEKFHVAAAVAANTTGVIDTITINADEAGYTELVTWADQITQRRAWAIEGTNSHGAGLTRFLNQELVFEVDRPKRPKRRHGAKSDHIDAVRAAREALGRPHNAIPRATTGPRAMLQALMTTRRMTINQASDTERQLRSMIITAPDTLKARFDGLTKTTQKAKLAAQLTLTTKDPLEALLAQLLRDLAQRANLLRAQAKDLEKQILALVKQWRPDLLDLMGVGPIVAAQLLITWSHPGRVRTEAAFAMMAGTAPIPASSGIHQTRHRLNNSGDRRLNSALHTIVLSRQRHDPATKAYIETHTKQGKSPREIRRCLKRYISRSIYRILEKGLDKT